MTEDPANPIARESHSFRDRIHDVIFGTESSSGRGFDVILLIIILASVVVVCLQTVGSIEARMGDLLWNLEWAFTIFFTIEYLARLYCVRKPWRYATSFFGIIDLLSFLPNYIGLVIGTAPAFAVVRALRLLRVFRILNLKWFMGEAEDLGRSVVKAQAKIVVFLGVVLVAVTMAGTLMYEVENWGLRTSAAAGGPDRTVEQLEQIEEIRTRLTAASLSVDDLGERSAEQTALIAEVREQLAGAELQIEELRGSDSKFTSIPQSMYWAIVTMTTVGYGDIVPTTAFGKILAAILILLGYSLIIVPTGFVSAEMMENRRQQESRLEVVQRACPHCLHEGHQPVAVHCCACGERLNSQ